MIRTANIEVSLQRLSILRIEHPQANPLTLACTLRAGEALPSGLTVTAEIHTSRNVAAETAPLASTTVTVGADATSFDVAFTSAQLNQTVTPNSTRALWLVLYGVGDADQLYTLSAADLLLGWHAISLVTADPPATAILIEKGGVAWATGSAYASGTVVTVGTTAYVASSAHTSGSSTQPGTGASWATVWAVLSGGGGGTVNLTPSRTANAVTITPSGGGTAAEIPQASDTNAGVMPADAHVKLSGIATGATANATDATLLDRANHTGTQAISTIVNLQTSLDGKAATSHTHAATDISDSTAAGRAILTAADATAQRTALGLGSLATQSGTFSGTSSGTNTGNVTLAASVSSVLALSGQQLQAVTDPVTDQILFFDQSASAWAYASLGDSLVMSGTTLSVSLGTPGPIGGTTPGEGTFNQINARTGIDVQSTVGSGGPLRVYNTPTTAPADYERGRIEWVSGVLTIGTESLGTGTARAMALQTAGVTRVAIGTTGLIAVNGATAPTSTPLSVKAINPNGDHTGIRLESAGATSSIVEIGGTTSNNGAIRVISTAAGTVSIQADNTHFPVNVGIGRGTGTFSPVGRLHVRGVGSGATIICRLENSSAIARFIVRDDGAFSFNASPTAVETGWTDFTNLTADRTCDANATTVEELADILGTLIIALKNKGIISA